MVDQNRNNQTVTWNNGATAFDGYKLNVTDTASAAASLLLNFQVGGTIKYSVRKDGRVTSAAGYGLTADDAGALGASGTAFSDLFLALGGVINWNAGDVTATHSANTLAFAGASSGYTFDAAGTFSGVIAGPAGSAGGPAHSFSADPNTGMYNSGADEVAFSVGGTAKGSFHSTGFNVSAAAGQLIDPNGATTGVSLSNAGALANYFTSGAGFQMGAGFAAGTMINFKRVGTSVGTITFGAGFTAYNTSSDKRKKYDWETFDSGAIMDAIEVWRFKWIEDGSVGYGVLAQDAQPAFPQAITEDEEGFLQADYSKYVPVLMAEIKDLRRRLAAAGL